jgi:hypothetical protein
MAHECRFVLLAALGYRRQIGRIGLHQQPVQGKFGDDGAQVRRILEGDDPGKRDVKADLQGGPRQLRAGGKAMDDARERALVVLLAQDGDDVLVGIAGMDDERQAGAPRRLDVSAETALLAGARAMLIVVVEAGLADADHLRVRRKLDQEARIIDPLAACLMRMYTHRTVDRIEALGDRAHGGKGR